EEMLHHEGVIVIKIWLHMDEDDARGRLDKIREADGALRRATVIEWENVKGKRRAKLTEAALELVEKTSTGYAPWMVIAAEDKRYRDAAVADLLLRTFERANADPPAPPAPTPQQGVDLPRVSLISALDLSQRADPETYSESLSRLQERI